MRSAARRRASECWTEKYLDIPFVDRGASFKGCDCFGAVQLIYREECGINLPTYPGVASAMDVAAFRTIVREAAGPQWDDVEPGREQDFDVVLLSGIIEVEGRKASRPTHVGLVVQPGRLIHIEQGTGVSVVDYRRHPSVKNRVISFHRYRPAQ